MSDPYGGQYFTAGNKYVDAFGNAFESVVPRDIWQQYYDSVGAQDAPVVWAEQSNQSYLADGQAIMTDQGVVSLPTALLQLQQAGYTGSYSDPVAIASAFAMLHTQKPASVPAPAPGTAAGGLSLSNLSQYEKPLLLVGAAYLLYEFVLKGGRR